MTQELQSYIEVHIPLARAMGASVLDYNGQTLTFKAPHAPNKNDKNTAFGGSISALLTLAGWGLVWLKMRELSLATDIVIHRSTVDFIHPIYEDLIAVAELPIITLWEPFLQTLKRKGQARVPITVQLLQSGVVSAELSGQYVVSLSTTQKLGMLS